MIFVLFYWGITLCVFAGLDSEQSTAWQGEVKEVLGEDVKIRVTGGGPATVGDTVELKYTTTTGMEIDVGTWKVTEVQGAQVRAAVVRSMTSPKRGLKAICEPKQTETSSIYAGKFEPGEELNTSGAGTLSETFLQNNSVYQQEAADSINHNLFSENYGKPVGDTQETYPQMSFDEFMASQDAQNAGNKEGSL